MGKSELGTSDRSNWIGQVTAPNGPDGAYYLAPVVIVESTNVRGRMRGMWQLCNDPSGFITGSSFGGANSLLGKTFQVVNGLRAVTGSNAACCSETSDTLETNT